MERCRCLSVLVFVILASSLSSAQDYPQEIDLFRVTGLLDKPLPKDVTRGTRDGRTSFSFGGLVPDLIATPAAYSDANKLIHDSHDFQVSAYAKIDSVARQSPANTLVSIQSKDGKTLLFRVDLSGAGAGDNLKIKVKTTQLDTQLIFTARRGVTYNSWHKIVVRFQDEEQLIRAYVDDELIDVKPLRGSFAAFPSDGQLRLAQSYEPAVESQPSIVSRFRGELQDVKLERGPECKGAPKPCKCLPSGEKNCIMDGSVYKNGQGWMRDKCSSCRCTDGQVICVYTCTPCKSAEGAMYISGEKYKSGCKDCECDENGKATCTDPKCPTLDCSGKSGQTMIPPGKCCPICKEDQCKGTDKTFKLCGSKCPRTCENLNPTCPRDQCVEGCFCNDKQALSNGQCTPLSRCGCTDGSGKRLKPGDVTQTRCQFCICLVGKMHCSRFC